MEGGRERERERENSLHSFQIYVIRYGSVLYSSLDDDDVTEAKKKSEICWSERHSQARHIQQAFITGWMGVKFWEFQERVRDIMIIGIWNEPEIYKLQLCDIQK